LGHYKFIKGNIKYKKYQIEDSHTNLVLITSSPPLYITKMVLSKE